MREAWADKAATSANPIKMQRKYVEKGGFITLKH